jgi:hypothetical protein
MTPRIARRALFAVLVPGVAWAATNPPISPAGQRLADLLDSMDVENLWQAKFHVDWRTGVSEGPREFTPGGHTHCSAFAAAAAERLGIYLLRPPEHRQDWLANAQERWLNDPAGAAAGWRKLGTLADPGASARAIAAANAGMLVVAVYFQPPRETALGPKQRSGHIAIVRPDQIVSDRTETDGPEVTQAGGHNYRRVALRVGFADHRQGLTDGSIEYFAHPTGL